MERVQITLNNCNSALSRLSKQRILVNEKVIKDKYELIIRLQATKGLHNLELIRNFQSVIGGTLEQEDIK